MVDVLVEVEVDAELVVVLVEVGEKEVVVFIVPER
jgi:hypothetical protein